MRFNCSYEKSKLLNISHTCCPEKLTFVGFIYMKTNDETHLGMLAAAEGLVFCCLHTSGKLWTSDVIRLWTEKTELMMLLPIELKQPTFL